MKKIEIKKGEQFSRHYSGDVESTCDLEIMIGDGARAEIFVQSSKSDQNQVITAYLGRDSSFTITSLDIESENFERKIEVNLEKSGAECNLHGVFITNGSEKCVNRIQIKHLAENCRSNQVYRGVASGSSYGLFNGAIYVAQDAQQTVAMQENHNVVVSNGAKIETIPQLEIYADRVKCNHGATIGREDSVAMFYLRQRGIEPGAARTLLLEGFCRSALPLDNFSGDVQDRAIEKLTEKLRSL